MTVPDPPIFDISTLTLTDVAVKPSTDPGSYTRRDLYEERQTPEAGIGAFATTNIPSGTRIFCEESIVMLPDEADQVEVYNAVKSLGEEKRGTYWALAASTKASRDIGWIDRLRDASDGISSFLFNS
ncbi:hypothetical protein TWF102_011745 [Orbilia oligospora]|uniref:SET domain-containing protein n=1 Tax=Orbilia oligospora TaxID=2813651 RepID=A0A7C8N2V3_ORBOL|nr:hypothetical protein TWF102_011745 [Orbilia oligospora]KAF3084965.1 hypothetical protein TWF102_011745 [Orbilia oligospora]KAF3104582.1 hypothetical protein TWF103_006902 [Orbilia oligospora]KAF3123161.1 hypothetical protein TWF594_002495 [Orbilia oligospora]